MLLKRGDNNEQVKQLQIKLGLEPIGNFGPKTEEAVKAFQSKNGLTADGIVGEGTWNKLMGTTPAVVAPTPVVVSTQIANTTGLKLDTLKGHVPDNVIGMIPEVASKFEINTPLRLAHFLAQCGHESGGFKITQENLNYSADGLCKIFGSHFHGIEDANNYARQPELIANRIYCNRMGNGDEASGDGYRYCGRGLIQLTGKSNYQAFAASIETPIEDIPAYLATFEGAAQSACWFWEQNNLNRFADANDVKGLTKAINGGFIGLEDRQQHTEHALHILGA